MCRSPFVQLEGNLALDLLSNGFLHFGREPSNKVMAGLAKLRF
jgi:hypothetical protein